MLGAIPGGCVRLSPIGSDGHLGIAEGIETALSAQAIFRAVTRFARGESAASGLPVPGLAN